MLRRAAVLKRICDRRRAQNAWALQSFNTWRKIMRNSPMDRSMTHTFWNTGRAIETVSMSEATIHHLYFWWAWGWEDRPERCLCQDVQRRDGAFHGQACCSTFCSRTCQKSVLIKWDITHIMAMKEKSFRKGFAVFALELYSTKDGKEPVAEFLDS